VFRIGVSKIKSQVPRSVNRLENPWYVLMTIAGEPLNTGDNHKLHKDNAYYWNGWVKTVVESDWIENLDPQLSKHDIFVPELSNDEINKIDSSLVLRSGVSLQEISDFEHIYLDDVISQPLTCLKYLFHLPVLLQSIKFEQTLRARDSIFYKRVDFSKSNFHAANFSYVTFMDSCLWERSCFSQRAIFKKCSFSYASFARSTFEEGCDFNDCLFKSHAVFENSEFKGVSGFTEVEFGATGSGVKPSGIVKFDYAIFHNHVSFQASVFRNISRFTCVKFLDGFDFHSSRFVGDVPKSPLFDGEYPPEFYGAKITGSADWTNTEWPRIPTNKRTARTYRRSYERLKMLMAEQNNFSEEHLFLRKALRAMEVEEGLSLVSLGSKLYRFLSGYGWSINRPMVALMLCWIIGAIGLYCGQLSSLTQFSIGKSFGLSFSNLLSFLGLGSSIFEDEISHLMPFSKLVVGIQAFVGPILLFFLVLGYRNRLRC